MLRLCFPRKSDSSLRILCLGAHSDDIEIGSGGTILRLIEEVSDAEFLWVVFASEGDRKREAYESANIFLKDAKSKKIVTEGFRESYFPFIGASIKEYFEQLKRTFSPDIILTHYLDDAHQDHRLVSELTWNTFRDHLVLEYEIPKYDGDLGKPNFYVHLSRSICKRKIKYILQSFKSQEKKQWFSEDTFLSTLRIRGIESNAPSGYAEAFYCRKMVF